MNVSDPTGLLEKDPELQHFIESQEQMVRLEKQIHKLTDECWDKCVSNPNVNRLDSKTESCLANCVERFIDASTYIVQNFSSRLDAASQQASSGEFGTSSSSSSSEVMNFDDNSFTQEQPKTEQQSKSSFKFW
jgi:mitochondrial import inner membrane translocase subunit TIM8